MEINTMSNSSGKKLLIEELESHINDIQGYFVDFEEKRHEDFTHQDLVSLVKIFSDTNRIFGAMQNVASHVRDRFKDSRGNFEQNRLDQASNIREFWEVRKAFGDVINE